MIHQQDLPPAPSDLIALDTPAPAWFLQACAAPVQSRRVNESGCSIHYLYWPQPRPTPQAPGILFLHGGGAHANWWRFIAPYFRSHHPAAAMDLSGMGDSGARTQYSATIRAREIDAVLTDAGFLEPDRPRPVIVGHSFGGLTAMRYASLYPQRLSGLIVAESPVRPPNVTRPAHVSAVNAPGARVYKDYASALGRFRLLPQQTCVNDFIVEHIARHSIRRVESGWSWKFDPAALTPERHAEPFRDYLIEIGCRIALIYGENSALLTPEILHYMVTVMRPRSCVVGIPGAQHHLFLDEPIAFISAVRAIMALWHGVDSDLQAENVCGV